MLPQKKAATSFNSVASRGSTYKDERVSKQNIAWMGARRMVGSLICQKKTAARSRRSGDTRDLHTRRCTHARNLDDACSCARPSLPTLYAVCMCQLHASDKVIYCTALCLSQKSGCKKMNVQLDNSCQGAHCQKSRELHMHAPACCAFSRALPDERRRVALALPHKHRLRAREVDDRRRRRDARAGVHYKVDPSAAIHV